MYGLKPRAQSTIPSRGCLQCNDTDDSLDQWRTAHDSGDTGSRNSVLHTAVAETPPLPFPYRAWTTLQECTPSGSSPPQTPVGWMGNDNIVACLARFNSTPGRGSTPVQLYTCKVLRTGPNGTLSAYPWRPSLRGTNVTDGLHATLRIAIGDVFPPRSKCPPLLW